MGSNSRADVRRPQQEYACYWRRKEHEQRENRNLKELSKIHRGRDFCDRIAGERQGEVAQNTALELKGSPLQEAMSALQST